MNVAATTVDGHLPINAYFTTTEYTLGGASFDRPDQRDSAACYAANPR